MRRSGGTKGGMQSAGVHSDLTCDKCHKGAARMELFSDGVAYLHFTKKGSIWHICHKGQWTRKKRLEINK